MSLLTNLRLKYESLPSEEPFRKIAARIRKRIADKLRRKNGR